MTIDERGGPRRRPHEDAGMVDHPFDEDRPASHPLIQSDAACSVPWLTDGFQAIQVFVDPAIRERAPELCATITALSAKLDNVDDLNEAIQRYARDERLSAGIHDEPPDAMSEGIVAVSFTLG